MSFLVPTVLWGLFGISIPILVHLVSMRRTQKVDFSTVRFIKSLEHDTIRKLKFRQWLLLALRTTAIILLVLAFARPVKVGYFPPWAAGQQASKMVFLLDNSASMSARSGGETLLERSKKTLLRIVKGMEGRVSVDVYQTSPLAKRYSGDPAVPANLESALSMVRESQERDDLWIAIPSVLGEAAQERDRASGPANWEFYVFSDFPLPLPEDWGLPGRGSQNPAPDWRFYLFPQPIVQNNMAVVSAQVTSQLRLPDLLVSVEGKVKNQALHSREDTPVQLYFGEQRVGQMVADFGPSERKDFVFRAFPNQPGMVNGVLQIPDDDYLLDNKKFFLFSVPSRIRCKVISPSGSDASFLTLALKSISDQKEFLQLETLSSYGAGTLSLEDVDVLILVDPSHLRPSLVEEIRSFAKNGGGIIAFLGPDYARDDSGLLNALGFPGIDEVIRLGGEAFHQIIDIDIRHPIFEEFAVANLSKEMPQVFSHLKVSPTSGSDELLSLSNGDPLLFEKRGSGSTKLFFTTLPDLEWSDLPVRGIFVPLLHRMLAYLATRQLPGTHVEVGSRVEIPLGRELMSTDLKLQKPSGSPVFLVPDFRNEVLVIDDIDEAGMYTLFSQDEAVSSLAANISPLEDPVNRMDSKKLSEPFPSGQTRIVNHEENALDSVLQARRGTELWPLFLGIVVVLLMGETWVGRVRRSTPERGKP